MRKIDSLVRGDVQQQIDALRQDMEEGLANITENNLKLSQPYAACRGGALELQLVQTESGAALQIYVDGQLAGTLALL